MEQTPTQQIDLPSNLMAELESKAKSMGMSVASYIAYLNRLVSTGLDRKATDAANFMVAKHAASLRKLAQ